GTSGWTGMRSPKGSEIACWIAPARASFGIGCTRVGREWSGPGAPERASRRPATLCAGSGQFAPARLWFALVDVSHLRIHANVLASAFFQQRAGLEIVAARRPL